MRIMAQRNLFSTVDFDKGKTENPLQSIHTSITSSSRDFGIDHRDAWIYGIAVGWDDASYNELKAKHFWSDSDVERNKRLHQKFIDLWLYVKPATPHETETITE